MWWEAFYLTGRKHVEVIQYILYFSAYLLVCRDSMEYADFLRGEDDAIPWDDVVPNTQEGIIDTQPPLAELQSQEAPTEMATGGGRGQSYTMKEDLLLVV